MNSIRVFLLITTILSFTNAETLSDSSVSAKNGNSLGITLAATGLALSVAAIPSSFVGLSGMLTENNGQAIYGLYVGPGLNIVGGIMSAIAITQLDNRYNSGGNFNELGKQRQTIRTLVGLGVAATAVSIAGSFLFYKAGQANDYTFTLTFPVSVLGGVLNSIAGIKSLKQNIKHRNGLKRDDSIPEKTQFR
jgi:hypothetical protein